MSNIMERRLLGKVPQQAVQNRRSGGGAQAPAPDPKSYYLGDVVVPWNIGQTIYRYKAPRDVRISEITLDAREIKSPSGAPVVIELWLNGTYKGTITLEQGANTFDPFLLKKLDEVEMRILVKGDREDVTIVNGLWILYCVA